MRTGEGAHLQCGLGEGAHLTIVVRGAGGEHVIADRSRPCLMEGDRTTESGKPHLSILVMCTRTDESDERLWKLDSSIPQQFFQRGERLAWHPVEAVIEEVR